MKIFKPMEQSDIDRIKELCNKMLYVDADAFLEIYNHMTFILESRQRSKNVRRGGTS